MALAALGRRASGRRTLLADGAVAGAGARRPGAGLGVVGGKPGVQVEGSARQRRHPGRGHRRGIRLRPGNTPARLAGAPDRKPIMDILGHLALGLSVALTPINLLYAFVGVLVGTLIGVLPGIGPVATI